MAEALKGESKYPHINKAYIGEQSELDTMCETYFTGGIQGKFPYMLQWMQNINYLAGNQWISYNPQRKLFEIDPNLDNEERITMNKILPAYRTAVGSMLRDRQKAIVLQKSVDEQDIDAAKVKTRLLEHVRRVNNGLSMQKEVLEWSAICGKGINKKWWDPDEDRIVDEVIQPFEFITPANVRKLKKMPWACHARYETTEWVYEMYGIDVSDDSKKTNKKINISGTSDYGQYGSFLAVVKHVMEDGYFTGSSAMSGNNVMIKEFWYRPCKKFPDGLLAIYANDIPIYADRNPISGKLNDKNQRKDFYFPFNEMDFFDLPFRYWPMGLIEPVIGMQMYYNKFQSYALENFKYAGMPTWWAQNGTVKQDEIVMDRGAVNEYSGQSAPIPNNVQPIQSSHFEVIAQMANGIGEMVGIHQFGRGSMPPGVHAAAALAIINEQDQITKMGLTVNLESFMSTDAKQTLYLIDKFWPDKFKIRYMGEENRWEVAEYDKSKYEIGDEEITIESKQELAQDKMTRFDQVMKLMTTARLDNPQEPIMDVNAGLRILDLEHEMGTVDLRSLNWNMAKDENQRMKNGERVEVFQYEDHKLHIEAHMQYMLRIDFKELDEKIINNFNEHYQQHLSMLNASQQSIGAQSTQSEQQPGQQPMMPQMGQPMPQMGQMPPMGQPPTGQQPNVMPFPNPLQGQPGPTGLASNLQGGMQNVMNQAFGRPGGV